MIVDQFGHPLHAQQPAPQPAPDKAPRVRRRLLASFREDQLRGALNEGFRRLTAGTPLYLMPQDTMILMSYWMYYTNDIIGGMVEKSTNIICGNGFDWSSKNEQTDAEIKRFWKDPVNDFPWNEDIYTAEAAIYGELIFTLFANNVSGDLRLGTVEPFDIQYTIPDPLNRNLVAGVCLKATAGGAADNVMTTLIAPGVPDSDIFSKEGVKLRKTFAVNGEKIECKYFAFNRRFVNDGSPHGVYMRGTPDLLSAFDPASDTDDVLFSMRRRADVASRIVWDVEYTGAGQEEIDDFLNNTPLPDENSLNVHNERIKWNLIAPDLKASEHETQYRMHRNHTISGKGGGMPPTWFGDGTDANRASATEMPFPTIKGLTRRQQKLALVFQRLIDYQLFLKKIEPDYSPILPTISEKNTEQMSNAQRNLTANLMIAEDRQWLTKDEARQIYRSSLADFGHELEDYETQPGAEYITPDYAAILKNMRQPNSPSPSERGQGVR